MSRAFLSKRAAEYLAQRGVTTALAKRAELRSLSADETVERFGSKREHQSLLIPHNSTYAVARVFGGDAKFVAPKDKPRPLYVPPLPVRVTLRNFEKDIRFPLYVVEGPIKALALSGLGVPCVGVGGCWIGEAEFTSLDRFNLSGREFVFITDADTASNIQVAQGWNKGNEWAAHRGARCFYLSIPFDGDAKRGIDDWIATTKATIKTFNGLTRYTLDSAEVSEIRAMLCKLDDTGNADRLVLRTGDVIRYATTTKSWFYFDKRWRADESAVQELAKESARSIDDLVVAAKAKDQREQLAKFARHSASGRAIRDAMRLASSKPEIQIDPTQFDSDPWLLGVPNGVVDLRTAKLLPHHAELLISRWTGAPYDPKAKAPTWLRCLEEWMLGDKEMVAFLQRLFGLALIGTNPERIVVFFIGETASGKSTSLETLLTLMGDYGGATRAQLLMRSRADDAAEAEHATPFLASLQGQRFVRPAEIDERHALNESLLKDLTGGDTISARANYGNPIKFKPAATIFIAGNHKPTVIGTDKAIWDRIIIVPFNASTPRERRDPQLQDKLRAELQGILAWAVNGCLAYQKHGLQIPKRVIEERESYQREQDQVQLWLDECARRAPIREVRALEVYQCYRSWTERHGMHPFSDKKFRSRMLEKGFGHKRSDGSWYTGIVLLDSDGDEVTVGPKGARPITNTALNNVTHIAAKRRKRA